MTDLARLRELAEQSLAEELSASSRQPVQNVTD